MSAERYLDAIHDRFKYLGTWLPNTSLKLGDIGTFGDEGFRKVTSLRRLGLSMRRRNGAPMGDLDHASVQSVRANVGVDGAGASITLGFGDAGSFVFQATGCTVDEIDEFDTLGIEMINLFKQGIWKKEWIVVDTVVHAQRATIIVSESADASLEVAGPTDISEMAKVDLSVKAQSGSFTRFVSHNPSTPLFRGRRVKPRWFGLIDPTLESTRSVDEPEAPEFDQVGPGDLFA